MVDENMSRLWQACVTKPAALLRLNKFSDDSSSAGTPVTQMAAPGAEPASIPLLQQKLPEASPVGGIRADGRTFEDFRSVCTNCLK